MQDSVPPNKSRLLFALLYLGEGGPIGFIWWALPTWLRLQGLDVGRITILTSILVLPWVGKFLWAPLIDRTRGQRGGLRAWIVSAQLLMGFTLLPLIWLDPERHFAAVAALLLAHA
ncbi:MAG: MFS transporter, partial [Verrucomicrobiota bacterium]|nr:MFS transporter [Verrucomicrobiota bacterium]